MARRKVCWEHSLKEAIFKVLGIMVSGRYPTPTHHTPLSASLILFHRCLLTICLQLWAVSAMGGACSVSMSIVQHSTRHTVSAWESFIKLIFLFDLEKGREIDCVGQLPRARHSFILATNIS